MSAGLRVSPVFPPGWADLAPLPLLASPRWFHAMSARFDGQPCWFSVPDAPGAAAPACGIAGFVVDRPGGYVYGDAAALCADPASPLAPPPVRRALTHRPTDTGALFPHLLLTYPGYATFAIGTQHDNPDAVGRLLADIVEWSRGEGLAMVALPYAEADGELSTQARSLGFVGLGLTVDASLEVPAGGFEEYLRRFGDRRRRKLAAERRSLAAQGLCGRRVIEVTPRRLDHLAQLRVQHRAKYGLPASERAERDRLEMVLESLAGSIHVFVVGPDDETRPLSFSLFVRDGAVWHSLYCGTDYTNPRSRRTYFEAVYYAPVSAGAALGISRISYGLGSGEAKRLRGCTAADIECLLLGLTPAAVTAVHDIEVAWRGRSIHPLLSTTDGGMSP